MQHNKCRSVSEVLGGGLALAIVALIAVGSAQIARPRASLPAAPLHYASTSIESSEEVAKLSLNEQDQPAGSAGETHHARSSEPVSNNAAALEPVVPARAPPPPLPLPPPPALPPAAVSSAPPAMGWSVGRGIEDETRVQSAAEARSPRRPADAAGRAPDRHPDARSADTRSHYTPAPARVRGAPTFVGGWSDDISRCRTGRETPLVISSRAAKTENGECDFGVVAREAANRWRVAAICTSEGQFWRANIALKLVEPNLTWSSERGTETYVRCKR